MTPFSAASASHLLDEREVLAQVLLLEARPAAAEVRLLEVVDRAEPAGEEAASERAVGDEADPELADGRQDLRLGIARPERVLGLQRRDRMDGVRAPDRLRAPPRRARGSAPCPPGRARPSRRRSPRSASPGRRGAGSRGRSSRRRAVSGTPRRRSGRTPALPLIPRNSPCSPRMFPNFVATTTSSRRPAIALPTSSSFVNGPYMSAVSRNVTPSSSARWIVAIASRLVGAAVELGHAHAAEPERRDLEPLRAQLARLHS